ncbi:MAG: hypothetical protein ACI84C_001660 [Flavobacteriales bacterium]|jgi:hypothetical protein
MRSDFVTSVKEFWQMTLNNAHLHMELMHLPKAHSYAK